MSENYGIIGAGSAGRAVAREIANAIKDSTILITEPPKETHHMRREVDPLTMMPQYDDTIFVTTSRPSWQISIQFRTHNGHRKHGHKKQRGTRK
jgi:predicted dinucleotide-binding enzyme